MTLKCGSCDYFLVKIQIPSPLQPRETTKPDSKVHGADMGPTWGRQDPGGPHVGHMNLAIWEGIVTTFSMCVPKIKRILVPMRRFGLFCVRMAFQAS